jgi:hypothetical protein
MADPVIAGAERPQAPGREREGSEEHCPERLAGASAAQPTSGRGAGSNSSRTGATRRHTDQLAKRKAKDARPKGAVSRLGELGPKGTHRNPEQDGTITLVLLAPSTESTFGSLKVRFSFAAPYAISRSNPSFVISVPLMGLPLD